MRIAITGTPGVGKTSVCRILGETMHYHIDNVNDIAENNSLIIDKDEERDADVIDTDKLSKIKINDYTIVEGHLAHNIENVDFVIVLRCDPIELKGRLENKEWKEDKVKENLEAEALGIIINEAQDIHDSVYEIDTTGKDEFDVAYVIQ